VTVVDLTGLLSPQVSADEAEARIKAANEPYKLEILQVSVRV
jgi:hypothetical protein